MDAIKVEQFSDPAAEQRENLLFLLGRMRQIQAASMPLPGQNLFKRSATDDQPLDFSAPAKHPRLSPDWLAAPDNKHDSLNSDGHSDVSSHSPRSTSGGSDSGRDTTDMSAPEQRPGSTSLAELPSLSIPSPNDTSDSSYNKSDLLTMAPKFPLLKPLSSLTEDVKQEAAEDKPLSSLPLNLPLPFSNFPVFPQPIKPSFPSSLPFPFAPANTPTNTPATEMNKLSVSSQEKYAEFREKMMKNMETGRVKGRRQQESSSEDSNVSLDSLTPQHHSTPTRDGKDAAYWERRRKNNEAAKRSRDARRMKENEVAVRASFLEQENIQLKMELVQLKTELGAIRDQINRRPLQPTL